MKFSSRKRKILIWIFIVSIIIVSFNIFQQKIRNFVYTISAPVQKVLWRAGEQTSDFLGIFVRTKNIREEIKKLNEENQKLTAKIVILKEIKKENEELRKALDIGLQNDFKLSFAEIIGKDISQDAILINKGSKDGVLKNMPIVSSNKILLGKIEIVYENSSEAILLSNKKISYDVKIQNAEDISGVGRGGGNSKILVNFVPREENISEGNLVISDSLGGIFPKGLLIGQVKNVEKNDVDVSQKIEVAPIFDIRKISNLFIIIDY